MATDKYGRLRKDLRGERNEKFHLAEDINSAIFGNLMTRTKGGKKRLSASNSRDMDKMMRLYKRTAQSGTTAVKQFKTPGGELGAMLASAVGAVRGEQKKIAKSGKRVAKAATNYGKAIDSTGNVMMRMAQEGVKEARAGATGMAAEALAEQKQADVAMVAQMEHEEQMMLLQHQLQMQQIKAEQNAARRMQAVEGKRAQKLLGKQVFNGMQPVADMLSKAAPTIMTGLQNGDDDKTILESLVERGIVGTDPNDQTAMGMYIRSLASNTSPGPDSFASEALSVMMRVPEWAQVVNTSGRARKRLLKYLESIMRGQQASYNANTYGQAGTGGGGGGYDYPSTSANDPRNMFPLTGA
jgi:hypothetical protein